MSFLLGIQGPSSVLLSTHHREYIVPGGRGPKTHSETLEAIRSRVRMLDWPRSGIGDQKLIIKFQAIRMIPTLQVSPNPILTYYAVRGASGLGFYPMWSLCGYSLFPQVPIGSMPCGVFSMSLPAAFGEESKEDQQSESSLHKPRLEEQQNKKKIEIANCQSETKIHRIRQQVNVNESDFSCRRAKLISKIKDKEICHNKNRNIIPSVVQQIFSYLSKPTKSKATALRIFALLEKPISCPVSIQRYFYFVRQIKDKLNHYLNQKSLKVLCGTQHIDLSLFSEAEQNFYLRMARVAAKHFVDNQLPHLIIHSKRMFEQKRIEHLKVRRLLIEVLRNLDC